MKDNEFRTCLRILSERHKECDYNGHKEPNIGEGMCNYCYRHLHYSTPKTDAIISERRNIPDMFVPFDAPIIMEKMRQEKQMQETLDIMPGVDRMYEELKKKGEL